MYGRMLHLGRGNERTNSLVQRQQRRKYIAGKKRRGEAEMSIVTSSNLNVHGIQHLTC